MSSKQNFWSRHCWQNQVKEGLLIPSNSWAFSVMGFNTMFETDREVWKSCKELVMYLMQTVWPCPASYFTFQAVQSLPKQWLLIIFFIKSQLWSKYLIQYAECWLLFVQLDGKDSKMERRELLMYNYGFDILSHEVTQDFFISSIPACKAFPQDTANESTNQKVISFKMLSYQSQCLARLMITIQSYRKLSIEYHLEASV